MLNAAPFRPLLKSLTYDHLRQCSLALDDHQYLASGIWAAVFLEAFLGDFQADLGIRPTGIDDLNQRITNLRQYSKNHGPEKPDLPDEIIKRCDAIRDTRNRLVHDTGLEKQSLREDAQSISAHLDVILNWYKTFKGESPQSPEPGASAVPAPRLPVFLSRASPDNRRQEYFLDALRARLRDLGIQPIEVTFSAYDRADPIGKTRDCIRACHGVIIIGLERSHAYFVRDKEGTDAQREIIHRKYTSGWLHLEAGLANALGKEVFIIRQRDLCNDGIFDDSWNSYGVVTFTDLDIDTPDLQDFWSRLRDWIRSQKPPVG